MKKILLIIIGTIISVFIISITSAIVSYNNTVIEKGNHQVVTINSNETIVFSLSKKIDSINFNKDS
jgi:competence protein ComGC